MISLITKLANIAEKLNKIGASVDGAKGNLSAFDKMEDKINLNIIPH